MNVKALARDIYQSMVDKARSDFWSGLRFSSRFKCPPPEYVITSRRILDGAGEHIHSMAHTCPCGGLCWDGWD